MPVPVITNPTTATGTVGVSFNFQVAATNTPLTFAAAGLPAGLAIDPATGLISGTPGAAGTTTVALSASNAAGASTPLALTLTIAAVVNPSLWTFDGVTAPDLGIQNVQRVKRSAEIDLVTFDTPGRPVDAAPRFALNSTVTVQRAGTPWFVGRVTRVPASGSDDAESQSYTLSGPWWYLEKLVCRQQWNVQSYAAGTGYVTETALSTRLILGQAVDGTLLTTGGVINATLTYAISCGAPLAIGIIDCALQPPLSEVKDVSCAEVIHKMLQWHPDCVAWFDYATSPHPTLHIRRRVNLTAVSFPVGAAPLSKIQGITARTDLLPPSVFIQYEVTGSSNGQPTFAIVTDAAPPGATGSEFGSLCFTIPLRGNKSTTVKQRVITRGIMDSLTTYTSDELRDYLIGKAGDMAAAAADPNVTTDGIKITKISRALADPNAMVPDPSGATTIDPISGQKVPALIRAVYDSSLANELVEGTITDWMRKNDAIEAQVHRITYTWTADSGDGSSSDTNLATYQGTVDITATNAGPGNGEGQPPATSLYSELSSYDPGDAVPSGLAAAYLAGLATLQYSGSVLLVEPEATGAAGLGNTLNLIGAANAAWATMAEAVRQESVEVDTGTTTLTFGPMDTLKPQDLVNLLHITRPGGMEGNIGGDGPGGLGTPNSDTRTTGVAGSQSAVEYGVTHPTANACPVSRPAAAATADFALYDASTPADTTTGAAADPAIGVRFGNISADGNSVTLSSGVDPYPDDFGDGTTSPTFGVAAGSGTGYVWVYVGVNADPAGDGSQLPAITGMSMNNGASMPDPDANSGYLRLGSYSVDGSGKVTILNSDGIGSQIAGYDAGVYFDAA